MNPNRVNILTKTLLLTLTLSLFGMAQADNSFKEIIATPTLLKQLQQGGFVIYMRHGNTDSSTIDDPNDFDLSECDTQRLLSDLGQQITKDVGQHIKQAKIPFDEVIASAMCRTQDSAKNAFGKASAEPALMYPDGIKPEQKTLAIATTRQLISSPPSANTNRVVVAHAPNMMALLGYKPQEATLIIFKPKGNGQFEYLGSIRPQDWATLLTK